MSAETLRELVTFRRAFTLPGLDRPHPPGTFEVITSREALDVSFPAFRLSLTVLLIAGGTTQALDVTRSGLDAALLRDGRDD